jgi:hypothetical protein
VWFESNFGGLHSSFSLQQGPLAGVTPAKPTQPLCQFRKDSDHSAATALSAGMHDRHAKQKESNEQMASEAIESCQSIVFHMQFPTL